MAELQFTKRAHKDIKKLSPNAQKQIGSAIQKLTIDPLLGDRLYGQWEGYRKLRSGDYRIVYKIVSQELIVVHYVRHRREVYRNR
ncbi:MAG: type II toxin-antitoxin system RelE/ParE family toxin [Actinobacteria bacterium]|nr:type II toxin-antitoxin system RelE/ParE family toxin [Actinomycetota bacterium]